MKKEGEGGQGSAESIGGMEKVYFWWGVQKVLGNMEKVGVSIEERLTLTPTHQQASQHSAQCHLASQEPACCS